MNLRGPAFLSPKKSPTTTPMMPCSSGSDSCRRGKGGIRTQTNVHGFDVGLRCKITVTCQVALADNSVTFDKHVAQTGRDPAEKRVQIVGHREG